jgi:superoxide dismutase, Fe-Mn family
VNEWIGELSKEEPVITFCVYRFHIGCETAATLRKAGFDARFMAGGHLGWKAAKGATKLFESASPSHGTMPLEQPVSPAPIIA